MACRQLLCWGPRQLALSVEFLFEILYVGATQSATANITL
ncbi:hypothetical protein AXF07_08170 [Staphylococcus aureus]|nr:hypothetical protein BRL61_12835 [Staphylococcus aureus]AVU15212.1 hypothetical protein AB477_13150 [Staphylococcus aureus]MCL9699047.1 hypothetical protein [Staphylococcus aureus]OSC60323.1 hypothetical protein B8A08_03305 [Staphylococcus aureus]OTG39774.1 hypothetical protein B7G59_08200 [Staphylococcus aureus]